MFNFISFLFTSAIIKYSIIKYTMHQFSLLCASNAVAPACRLTIHTVCCSNLTQQRIGVIFSTLIQELNNQSTTAIIFQQYQIHNQNVVLCCENHVVIACFQTVNFRRWYPSNSTKE